MIQFPYINYIKESTISVPHHIISGQGSALTTYPPPTPEIVEDGCRVPAADTALTVVNANTAINTRIIICQTLTFIKFSFFLFRDH